jgi:hypothetical protein
MLKNPCNSTKFYSYTHDKHPPESPLIKGGLRGVLPFSKWLAGHINVFVESQGKPFSAYLPPIYE